MIAESQCCTYEPNYKILTAKLLYCNQPIALNPRSLACTSHVPN